VNPFPEVRRMSILKNRVCLLTATLRRLSLAAAMGVLCTLAIANPPCPSDLDGDGEIGGGDVAILLLDWGSVCPEDPPSITAVSPSYGPTEGGTTITITGTSLSYARQVKVGGVVASNVVVVDDTTVRAVTPPGVLGPANVMLTTVGGNTAALGGAYSYVPPWSTVLEFAPNANAVPDPTLRAAITATGKPWRVRDNGTGIEMVLIPPGTFTMGCSASNSYGCGSDETQHHVTLTNAFYLSRTEVTQAQWVTKMGSNPSYFTGDTSRPVEQVSWNDIQPFCTATGMRLPTEAEWEYAYRAGTTTAFHGMPGYLNGTNDDNQLGTIAWFGSNSGGQTHAVAGKAANGFGLYDMAGNVFEWCQDWWGAYASDAQTNPTGPSSGNSRLLRGGAWGGNSGYCRASLRYVYLASPDYRYYAVGFRVARTP
ncbi:MAG: formylglycine-generating enzyme family protein, partial [Actinobacteria bacterium]|nr:formylglycine-generating enzyme family protein [Actinomycetota bacterium]